MTAQEAIRRIRDHNEVHSVRERNFAVYITEALNMAIEALEKQIPKKLKDDGWLYCPICGRDVLLDRFDYCPDCGQALDWSDTE